MKKLMIGLGLCFGMMTAYGQTDTIEYANTIRIYPGDSEETIVAKAAHVIPTERQVKAMENEFIAFIHFGPNTFSGLEWGTGIEDAALFNPTGIDADQWVKTMKDAGMKMVILTVKHHDGYVIWQSRYTGHGIMNSPFMDGKGDVLKELSEACAKYGMKLGVYLSPADLYQIESPDGLYGNQSERNLRRIPKEVEGRPFENKTTFEFMADDYDEYFMSQLFEILTEYGPIYEVWFDNAHPKQKGGQTYNTAAWLEMVRTLAPEAIVMGGKVKEIRWCGNEAGRTRDTEWNIVPYDADPATIGEFQYAQKEDIGSREMLKTASYLHYQYPETDTSIRDGWFYRDDDKQAVRTADDVFDIYERTTGGNAILLLNIPPNKEGRFSERDVNVMNEVGKRIKETYSKNLLDGGNVPAILSDGDWKTGMPIENDIVISLPQAITMNRFVLQEPVPQSGERIEEHAIDARIDGEWKEVAKGTNIGYKRILRFPDVTTDSIRVRILSSRLSPILSTVEAYHYNARPPQLQSSRDLDGMVSIYPWKSDFKWKNGVKDAVKNLSQGVVIRYTTDGTEPTATSAIYTEPFVLENGTVKAIAELNGETGPVLSDTYGLIKKNWKVTASANDEKHPGSMAVDANADTYWMSDSVNNVFIVDLGNVSELSNLAYTPYPSTKGTGMISKGKVEISSDGKKWTNAGEFNFGNLINDPTVRYYDFPKPIKGRFVKITPIETAAGDGPAIIAELDIY